MINEIKNYLCKQLQHCCRIYCSVASENTALHTSVNSPFTFTTFSGFVKYRVSRGTLLRSPRTSCSLTSTMCLCHPRNYLYFLIIVLESLLSVQEILCLYLPHPRQDQQESYQGCLLLEILLNQRFHNHTVRQSVVGF